MIFYNNVLAKSFLKEKESLFQNRMVHFTRYKCLEIWEDMEVQLHEKQFEQYFFLTIA
ncbi:hypothetical protein EVA_00894, partial [gut metagenome]